MSDPTPISTPAEASTQQIHICKSCGNEFLGLYCNQCGEKILEPRDRSFKTFLTNIQVALTFADNKFLKSLKLIIANPGFLSKEYVEGRRVNYIKPLQMFFVLNLIYFLFPLVQLFNTSLNTQMYLRSHSRIVRQMVTQRLADEHLTYQAFNLIYNEKSTSLAKLLIIVFVLFASLPFNLIYRKKNRYFTDHLTLSVELVAFNLAMNAILLSLFLITVNKLIHWTHAGWEKYLDDTTLTVIFVLTNVYFLFLAGRKFYNQRGLMLIIKVVLGMVGLFVALELYRMLLFLVTFYAL
jgi:hypothetical protein